MMEQNANLDFFTCFLAASLHNILCLAESSLAMPSHLACLLKHVEFAATREERLPQHRLCHHAAQAPKVHALSIELGTEQQLRCSVPQRRAHPRHRALADGPCEAEVTSQF